MSSTGLYLRCTLVVLYSNLLDYDAIYVEGGSFVPSWSTHAESVYDSRSLYPPITKSSWKTRLTISMVARVCKSSSSGAS